MSGSAAEPREKLGDLAELKLIAAVNAGDYRAISLVLLTICRNRGYVLPKGAPPPDEGSTNSIVISQVQINAVDSGTWFDAPGVEGGKVIDGSVTADRQTKKLN